MVSVTPKLARATEADIKMKTALAQAMRRFIDSSAWSVPRSAPREREPNIVSGVGMEADLEGITPSSMPTSTSHRHSGPRFRRV